ncbi:hypothetical protein [Flavobacterium terrisoli]|uniref:hypothetical protein n=1 Tax=Flavobacterium terrisoli TaxID=3242195 RepID=UPI002542BF31|nr:hypothetical protein [Flavobacterium buctense]
MILDYYFRKPIFWDYTIAIIVVSILLYIDYLDKLIFPSIDRSLSITSDLSNVGLTLAGFILTLLTVLITFKSASKISKEQYSEDDTIFDLFFVSDLYFITVRILKNCIKSLIVISVVGYAVKLSLPQECFKITFFYNIFALIVLALSVWRCLLILSKILHLQK